MRLRIARKVLLIQRGSWPYCLTTSEHRPGTLLRAHQRIYPIHRRHFPGPVLRPISHRKAERPLTTTDPRMREVTTGAKALMEKGWGPDHVYGPADVNIALGVLAIFFRACPRSGRVFIVTQMQELLGAMVKTLAEDKPHD